MHGGQSQIPCLFDRLEEWMSFFPQLQEYHNLLVSVHSDQTAIYLSLGNSALALYHAYEAIKVVEKTGPTMDHEQIMRYLNVDLAAVAKESLVAADIPLLIDNGGHHYMPDFYGANHNVPDIATIMNMIQ